MEPIGGLFGTRKLELDLVMVWSLLTIYAGNTSAEFARSVGRYKLPRPNISEYGELILIKSNNNCVEITSCVMMCDTKYLFSLCIGFSLTSGVERASLNS
jgi:hypothetical protein